MGRPPLPLGTAGDFTLTTMPNGHVRARTRYRDMDGKIRLIERHGDSKDKAKRALRAAIADRQTPTSGTLERTTRVTELAAVWWVVFQDKDSAPATVRRYREVLDWYILPKLGAVRLNECSVGLLDNVLQSIKEAHGAATAKLCQTVMRHLFSLATRRDAIPSNPMLSVEPVHAPQKAVDALTVDQVHKLREQLPQGDLRDVLDVLLATGARIGEVLALRWEDVEIDTDTPRLSITGTVVRGPDGKIQRQAHPKSAGSHHRLFIPPFGADVFRRRRQWTALVFPSGRETPMDPSNFRKKWRAALKGSEFERVHPHMIRATVATRLAHTSSVAAASAQLGHASEAITLKHYVQKLADAPDASAELEAFAGK